MAHPLSKATYQKNRDSLLQRRRFEKYGISHATYMQLWDAQKGLCAVCQQVETMTMKGRIRTLCVDHNHTTGKIRALLCARCNSALGMLDENSKKIEALLLYLKLHEE